MLANAAPVAALRPRPGRRAAARAAGDWYAEVAPDAYQALFALVRRELGTRASLPPHAADLTPGAPRRAARLPRRRLVTRRPGRLPRRSRVEVGKASADRWRRTLAKRTEAEAVLWRLLRIGSAPYFVLGAQRDRSLRLRVMTPWDWRQAYELKRMDVWGDDAGQPQVRWQAIVRDRATGEEHTVDGHVEVRWSHGRFGKPPEAKAYLDTPHHRVPGYVTLAYSVRSPSSTDRRLGDGLHALEGLAHAVAQLVVVVVLAAEEELGEHLGDQRALLEQLPRLSVTSVPSPSGSIR